MERDTSNDKLSKFEIWKFVVDTLKWIIVSGAFVWVSFIIDNGFKERNAGIQEMQAFDKYIDVILKADNTEARWKLAVFFSTVTPTDRLRDRWVAYKDSIKPDYDRFVYLKKQQDTLRQKVVEGKHPDALVKLNQVTSQLVPYEKRLSDPTPAQVGSNGLEGLLKNFKDRVKGDSSTDIRFKLDSYFKMANDINNSIVYELIKELGDPYSTIQSGIDYNYKEATFSNQLGIISRFDNNKKIWPVFQAKFIGPDAIFTLKENGVTESFKSPLSNIDWSGVKQFEKKYFIDRLNQLG